MSDKIDERIVKMSFDNAKFEAGVKTTLNTLTKLNDSLKNIGKVSGLDNLEKAVNKISFANINKQVDDVNKKADFSPISKALQTVQNGIEKLNPLGALSSAFDTIKTTGANAFQGIASGVDYLKSKFDFRGPQNALADVESAANRVTLQAPAAAAERLSEKFHFAGAIEALGSIERAAGLVTLAPISAAIDHVERRFSVLKGAASVALGNIVAQAVYTGIHVVKSLTVDPVLEGFHNYETRLNAVQTILANTGLKGAAGLKEVNKTLAQLNTYANKTIYNFSEMARNIGTFTAAGVKLKPATQAIKGIANLAALSGSNAEQASGAMYQLSQAISANRFQLQDYRSVINAGIGGHVFQKSIIDTAIAMGRLNANAVKVSKSTGQITIHGQSFSQALSAKSGKSFIDGAVLTKTLAQFSGDLTDAQLKADGFTKAQIKSIQALSKTANDAATKVKTFSQLMQSLKEEVASAFGQVFLTIFGDLPDAKKLFSPIHQSIENFLTNPIKDFNKVLKGTFALGGKKDLFEGFTSLGKAIKDIVRPIHEAFRDIFPKETSSGLLGLIKGFKEFTKTIDTSKATREELRATFRGIFAIFDIGRQFVVGVAHGFVELFKSAQGQSGGFLALTASVGDFLVKLDKTIKKGDVFDNFFKNLADHIRPVVQFVGDLAGALAGLFGGLGSAKSFNSGLDATDKALKPIPDTANKVADAFDKLAHTTEGVRTKVKNALKDISGVFKDFSGQVEHAVKNADYSGVFAAIQTTLVAGIFVAIRKSIFGGKSKKELNVTFGSKGFLKQISGGLDVLNGSLVSIQKNIQANTLLQISTAVGVLSAAVVALSLVDPHKLTKAMAAVAVGLAQLVGAMALITHRLGSKGAGGTGIGGRLSGLLGVAEFPIMAAGLILLAAALDVMVIAIAALGHMKLATLGKGLGATAAGLILLESAMRAFPADVARAISIAASITILSGGLIVMAGALALIGHIKLETTAKGLLAITTSLALLFKGLYFISDEIPGFTAGLIAIGAGLIVFGAGLTSLAVGLKVMGTIDLKHLAQALVAMFGSFVLIFKGLYFVADEIPAISAGLIALGLGLIPFGIGLVALAKGVQAMGRIDIKTLAQSLVAIFGTLAVIEESATFTGEGTLALALLGAALIPLSAGLVALSGAVLIFGHLNAGTVAKGLAYIGASLLVLAGGLTAMVYALPGAAALIAAAVGLNLLFPAIALFGHLKFTTVAKGLAFIAASILVIGFAGAYAAPGLLALASAFVVMGVGVAAAGLGIKLIAAGVNSLGKDGAKNLLALSGALVAFTLVLPKLFFGLIKGFVGTLADVAALAPELVASIVKIAAALLQGITELAPKIPPAVTALVQAVFKVINDNIDGLIDTGAHIILAIVQGIENNIGAVTTSTLNIVTNFLAALAGALPQLIVAGASVLFEILRGVANNIISVTHQVADIVARFIGALADRAPDLVGAGAKLLGQFILGIANHIGEIVGKVALLAERFIGAVADHFGDLLDSGARAMGKFLSGIAQELPKMADKGAEAIVKFLNGMSTAIRNHDTDIADAMGKLAASMTIALINAVPSIAVSFVSTLLSSIKKEIESLPGKLASKVGKALFRAAIPVGVDTNTDTTGVTDTLGATFRSIGDAVSSELSVDPTITPIVDLTQVRAAAQEMEGIFAQAAPTYAPASFGVASTVTANKVAAATKAAQDKANNSSNAPDPRKADIRFVQNNYSPTALSVTDVYRQTRNQLSLAKSALGVGA